MKSIETKRRLMNIPTSRLCAAANVGKETYREALLGRTAPSPATLAKLNTALHRFRIGFAGEASKIAPHAAFRACVLVAALYTGADAKRALNSDPSRRATADPLWLAESKVRRLAFSIANQWLGFSISDVARSAGVTKAAVSSAIKELEDLRDTDAQLDRVLNQIEEIFA